MVFDTLEGVAICCACLCPRVAAGPSGVDTLCTLFCQTSVGLCSSLALVARHPCTIMVHPSGFSFVAYSLFALDKMQ